ncbi:MAG: sensor histidine kinase [Promethearchaeota archaeon]
MQLADFTVAKDMTLIVLGAAFLLQVSISLLKYAVNRKFVLWSVGWTLFSAGAASSIIRVSEFTEVVDFIALPSMAVASIIILDAAHGNTELGKRFPFYLVAFIGAILLCVLGLAFALPLFATYTPIQILVAYSCFTSVAAIQGMHRGLGIAWAFAIIGFLTWGFSGLLYSLLLLSGIPYLAAILQAIGIIITGASLMGFYADITTDNLRKQYNLAELMSMTLQHDIRGYVQTASLALEAHQAESDTSLRLMIASQAMEDAIKFCESMREISASLLRLEASHTPLHLAKMAENVALRVRREHGLKGDRLAINLEQNPLVYSNQLVEELLWNIVHNSLRHGGSKVLIQTKGMRNGYHYITISDNAGGMPKQVKDYLNASHDSSVPDVPGSGLGLALIKGLTEVCGASLSVSDILNDSEPAGTEILLGFQLA